MIGTCLNERYRVDAQVGTGGMGAIYRGHDILLGRNVAIKVLWAETIGAETRHRLLSEAQIAAQLNHPNIVSATPAAAARRTRATATARPRRAPDTIPASW